MLETSSEDITEGPLGRALAALAAPVVAQQLVLIGQTLVDIFWVGRISADAVAAVGLVTPLLAVFGIGTQGVSVAGQILVSQRYGADDTAGARKAAGHAMALVVAINTVLAVVVFGLADPLVRLVGATGQVATFAVAYISVLAFSKIVSGLSDMIEYSYQGAGDTRTPFALNVVAIVVNLVLDPFLIFGWWRFPELGIQGAALATMIGYGVAAVLGVATLVGSRTEFGITRAAFVPDRETFRQLVRIGAPRGGQGGVRQLARLVVVWIVATTGGAAGLAAYTLGARIAAVAFVPALAIGRAAATVVGQNLGADRTDRASRATWLGVTFGVVVIGAFGVVQWLVPGVIARLFVPGIAGETLALTVAYLQILAIGYWALGAIHTVEAGFNGAGRTEISMYSTALQYWTVRIPVAAVLAFPVGFGLGAVGAFWAVTVSNVVAAIGLTLYFRRSTAAGMLERAADTSNASSAD
ncbi:MAG: MATE family efflux transporter [Halobaculum sp.]